MSHSPDIIVRPIASDVRITIVPGAAAIDAPVGRAWAELRRENPRLHDGSVLFALPGELRCGELCCRVGGYKELATAACLGRAEHIRALGVCGLVVGRDARGEHHVLFGRRGMQTRIYRGMWENAPSGTVSPRAGVEAVTLDHLVAALCDEGLEELGIDLGTADVRAVAMLEDAHACSVDVVLSVALREQVDPRMSMCPAGAHRWEYLDVAWVALTELDAWIQRDAAAISPPTLGLIRWWLGEGGGHR